MATFAGRYTGTIEGDFVIFLIGMRVNKPWKVHRWLPVFLAMPRMLRELEREPDTGLSRSREAAGLSRCDTRGRRRFRG